MNSVVCSLSLLIWDWVRLKIIISNTFLISVKKSLGDTRIWTMDLSDCSRLLYHWAISPDSVSRDNVGKSIHLCSVFCIPYSHFLKPWQPESSRAGNKHLLFTQSRLLHSPGVRSPEFLFPVEELRETTHLTKQLVNQIGRKGWHCH